LFIAAFIIVKGNATPTVQNTSEYKNINNARDMNHYSLNMVLDGTVEKKILFTIGEERTNG